MSEIKTSDKVMGTFGILFSFIIIAFALLMVSRLILLQEDYNTLADETCADSFFGCTAEEEEAIDEFMDSVQSKVVIWQTMWGLVFFSGLYLTYASFRLSMGINLFRGLIFPEEHPMHVDDRRYFIFTLIGVILISFGVGFGEMAIENGFYDDLDELAGVELERDTNTITESNGGITGSCTTVFLFLMLIISFFTRGRTEAVPAEVKELSEEATELDELLPPK